MGVLATAVVIVVVGVVVVNTIDLVVPLVDFAIGVAF